MNRKYSRISLNCSLSAPPTTQDGCNTPNTPEILNTIVNITSQMCHQFSQPEPSNIVIPQPLPLPSTSYSDISDSTTTSSLYSPISPFTTSLSSPHESSSVVQDFHSQFVKEGLKMKVKQKLKMEPEDSLQEKFALNIKREEEDLSPDDEVRRRKRRERNKVAAEKCRNKKKKETLNLFAESKSVERANAIYKDDIARLEAEQRHLISILEQHQPTCKKRRRDSSASQPPWHFDDSNTFRVPTLPASKHHKSGGLEPHLKTETEEIVLLVGDYSAVQGDCEMEGKEQNYKNVFQTCSFARSTPPQCDGQKYASLTYPGYNLGCGYYDSVCAAM
eukprot:GFUD01017679.1.p1 GENE.GFUD01017679.1~~GFUD01017679.1.p1  ORF type:complete len:360 (-),score=80.88 GFUD01017679.1:51-1049(-)